MAAPPRALIAGNWKMNGLRADGLRLARDIAAGAAEGQGGSACDLLVCPPATLVAEVAEALGASKALGASVAAGGQDCHAAPRGAHTGEVSAELLADLGCRYVIVRHSERR
ncbi:MAG: triose-phosphate isomerase, partial [Proteobacteria bacterium]|nr:triose-phosphate isomerase [Pseudomonadota bacterium]